MISEICQNEIQKIFQKCIKKHSKFLEVIFNLLLVCHGVRPSFLFEESNFNDKIEEPTKLLHNLIKVINENTCLHLKTTKDNFRFTRIFVYLCETSRREVNEDIYPVDLIILDNRNAVNDDSEIAQMLGFLCVDHNYSSNKINRTSIHFYLQSRDDSEEKINFKSEVCETKKFKRDETEDILKLFRNSVNNVVKKYNYNCFYEITEIYSIKSKLKKLKNKDIEFIKDNLDEYINDLANYYISDDEELQRSTTYKKFIDIENTTRNKKEYQLLIDTYEMIDNDEFDVYYENADTYDKIKKVATQLADEDIRIWENIKL